MPARLSPMVRRQCLLDHRPVSSRSPLDGFQLCRGDTTELGLQRLRHPWRNVAAPQPVNYTPRYDQLITKTDEIAAVPIRCVHLAAPVVGFQRNQGNARVTGPLMIRVHDEDLPRALWAPIKRITAFVADDRSVAAMSAGVVAADDLPGKQETLSGPVNVIERWRKKRTLVAGNRPFCELQAAETCVAEDRDKRCGHNNRPGAPRKNRRELGPAKKI